MHVYHTHILYHTRMVHIIRWVTGPLVSLLLEKDPVFPVNVLNEQLALKQEIHFENRCRCGEVADTLHPLLPLELQRSLKGASSWLTVLPLDEHGFSLHKGDFRDAVCLRYGWPLLHLPTECVCGTSLTVDHAFTCPHGGYPTLHHNELRDITAQLMSEVCPNVATAPTHGYSRPPMNIFFIALQILSVVLALM